MMGKLPLFSPARNVVPIRAYSRRVRQLVRRRDIRTVVAALTLDHFDPHGSEITDIGNLQRKEPDISVRLDRQGNTTEGAANLQIQVNRSALAGV